MATIMMTKEVSTIHQHSNEHLRKLTAAFLLGFTSIIQACTGLERSPKAPTEPDVFVQTAATQWVESTNSEWVLASIHNHSVWNFEWMYDSSDEMDASEKKDALRFAKGLYDEVRNFEIAGYRELHQLALNDGIDVAVVTEHNTIIQDHLVDRSKFPEIFSSRPLLILNATEWTSDGAHVGVFDYKYNGLHDAIRPATHDGNSEADIQKMTTEAKKRGGFTIMNHPRFWIKNNVARSPLGSDGVEVFGNAPGMEAASREFWHNMLVKGHRWFAVGSSDWHRGPYINFPPFGLPSVYNLVRVDGKLTQGSFYEGLRSGRLQITKEANKLRLIEMQMEGQDGRLCRMGDVCDLGEKSSMLKVRVTNADGLDLVIITGQESADEYYQRRIVRGQKSVYQLPLNANSQFVRAELYDGSTLAQASNPLYLR